MAIIAEAAGRRDPRTRNLWFDVASVADREITPANAAKLVLRLRTAGIDRVLYGTDAATGNNLRPFDSWAAFRKLPMTEAEFATIARNVAPYMKSSAAVINRSNQRLATRRVSSLMTVVPDRRGVTISSSALLRPSSPLSSIVIFSDASRATKT